ncbi:nucleotidyltransferase domain-containing protein [Lysinibacillus sp. NPDC095746]|uniref:nucleotidyltransferase domain-containing protein n=1 Tax=Lysinibacillus sp. NPDC095746 TaxID=3364134 RepID=UPI00381893EA
MRKDIDNWESITVTEIYKLFSSIPIKWGIAGGWALDLHLGKQSRVHDDIDVIILREEQLTAYNYLSGDWMLYKAENGKLVPWQEGEFLKTTNDIWATKSSSSPWAFQIMLVETEQQSWIYRREKSIRRRLEEIFLRTDDEIPYLRPEIQLLYKGGSSKIREKDFKDLQTMLPYLLPEQRDWLKMSLKRQFPTGHSWLDYI